MVDILAKIKKDDQWINYVRKGAKALPLEAVKKIFKAPTRNGRLLDYEAIRNKAIAVMFIANHSGKE